MSNLKKKPSVAFWATVVGLVYFASFAVVFAFGMGGLIPVREYEKHLQIVYAPIILTLRMICWLFGIELD